MAATSVRAVLLAPLAKYLLIGLAASPGVAAQETALRVEDASAPVRDAGGQVFEPAFFDRFAPKSAADMVRNIPGFSPNFSEERRGFGQGGDNVIINGRRISSKSSAALEVLGRVSTASVVRIEIVDGASLLIPGLSGQVANVVTRPKGLTGQWESFTNIRADALPTFTGKASIGGEADGLVWSVEARNFGGHGHGEGTETVLGPGGALIDLRREGGAGGGYEPGLSAELTHNSREGNIFNLNLSAAFPDFSENEVSRRSGPVQPDRLRTFDDHYQEHGGEIGGDYEFGLGSGRLKLIGLARYGSDEYYSQVFQNMAGASALTGSRFSSGGESGEAVLRSEYSISGLGGDWQGAFEGAFNFIDTESQNETLRGGEFVASDPAESTRVEEKRAEASLTYSRPLQKALDIQASLGGEISELKDANAGGLTREFVRPKGFVSLAWKPEPDFDLNLRVERQVGQLDFEDFASSEDLANGVSTSGNSELTPEQSWALEVEANRRLGKWGAVKLKLSAEDIEDVVDRVPLFFCDGSRVASAADCVAPGALSRRQAVGNLPAAERYEAEVSGTIQLDPLGLKGLRIEFEAAVGDSSVVDPVTGEDRRIGGSLINSMEIDFRYDLPGTPLAFGGGINHEEIGASYSLDQISRPYLDPFTFAYIEHKDLFGVKARLQVANLSNTVESFRREVYAGDRTGPLRFLEDRSYTFEHIFQIRLSDSF